MELDSIFSGSAPRVERFFVGATTAAGVPVRIPGAGNAGLIQPTTTSAADMIGCTLDSATYATAQQSDGSDPQAEVSVIVNPDAVWEAKLSGGGTENTALTVYDVTTASTDGLSVTTGDDWSSPEFDEGTLWGLTGANKGIVRKITSTSSTAATVTVALPNDTAVGDEFLRAPFFVLQSPTVTLSTNFTQVDASVAVSTSAAELVPLKLRANERNDSTVLLLAGDHVFGNRPS